MHKLTLACAALASLAVSAQAQLEMDCVLQHDAVCPYEPLQAVVTMKNDTGVPMVFKNDQGGARFGFYVMDESGSLLEARTNAMLMVPTTLASQALLSFTNNLALLFDLRRPGAYTAQSWVEWGDQKYYSQRRFVDVVAGAELARAQAGLPQPQGGYRQYVLLTIQRERGHELLFRIDDTQAGICYGVFDLGHYVPLHDPELKTDSAGRAHILHQASPSQFLYEVFDPMGNEVDRQEYGHEFNVVRMKSDGGDIAVEASAGGRPSGAPIDIPSLQTSPRMK